jgi:hypothetical protein
LLSRRIVDQFPRATKTLHGSSLGRTRLVVISVAMANRFPIVIGHAPYQVRRHASVVGPARFKFPSRHHRHVNPAANDDRTAKSRRDESSSLRTGTLLPVADCAFARLGRQAHGDRPKPTYPPPNALSHEDAARLLSLLKMLVEEADRVGQCAIDLNAAPIAVTAADNEFNTSRNTRRR